MPVAERLHRAACSPGLLRFVCAAILASGLAWPAFAATISNTASATFTGPSGAATIFSNTVTLTSVPAATPSTVTFWQYAPGAPGTTLLAFDGGDYDSSGGATFAPLPAPMLLDGTVLSLAAPLEVRPASVYHADEPVFITLADSNRNTDPALRESIVVTITTSNGDTETLRMDETGPDTGLFAAVIQSAGSPPAVAGYDGRLSVDVDVTITVDYQDAFYPADTSTAIALVDPFGFVFDSLSGAPVDGVTVTITDTVTGLPATVFGDDGVSAFPSTITTGGSASDSGGAIYNFPAGGFRFPFVAPGSYRFAVTAPAGYSAPSTIAPGSLPDDPLGNPYSIVTGSYGEVFTVMPGPALHIDMPIDPQTSDIVVQKTVSQPEASVGDFLQYRVTVRNTDGVNPVAAATLADVLPFGFRFQPGSLRLNGVASADPAITADGRTLSITLGNIAAGATVDVRYVVLVAAGTQPGSAVNSAQATGNAGTEISNMARVAVEIREPLFSGRFTLIGRVFEGECGTPWEELRGVANARIMLEDGTYVVTDADGQYHVEGLVPGTHVVQLDIDALPAGLEPVSCIENTRFAGSAYSQFVDVRGGGLWRADFVVHKRKDDVGIRVKTKLEQGEAAPQPEPSSPVEPAAPAGSEAQSTAVPAAGRKLHTWTLKVEFDSCRSGLKQKARSDIDDLARRLAGTEIAGAEIIGHADDRDLSRACEAQYGDNNGLSIARAKSVAAALQAKLGLQPEQVLVHGYGRDKPLFFERTFFSRARNRRTEAEVRFHVLEGAPVPAGAVEEAPAAPDENATAAGATAVKVVTGIAHRIDVDGSAPVQNLRVMAMLPEGYIVEPGSTRIDEQPAADPVQDGTLVTFVAGDVDVDARSGRWQRAITFRVRLAPGAPAAAATDAAPVVPVGEIEKYTLNAEFDSCRTELKPESESAVNDLVAQLKGADIARIELTGNTDDQQLSANCRQRFADNDDLSRARARAIGERLATALSLQPSQIVSRGEGSRRPLLSNLTLLGKARNRRTEVRVFLRADVAPGAQTAGAATTGSRAANACNALYEVKALAAFAAGRKPGARTPAASSSVQCPSTTAPAAIDGHAIEEHAGDRQSVVVEGAGVKPPDADLLARRSARDSIVDDVAASRAGVDWLAGQQPGVAWLFPGAGYNPRSPSTRIVVKHAPGQDVVLERADGSAVSGLAFDGTQVSADRTVAVSAWRAVSLREGNNGFRAIVKNADGTVAGTVEGAVAYANTPARAELVPEQSILRADGMTRPVIAVRIRDRDGNPVRHGVGGSLRINKPFTAWEEVERQQDRALAGLDRFEPRYQVEGDDGIAYVELAPTTETGNVELALAVDSGSDVAGSEIIRAWIEPTPRDWVVVGFAEGTVGYQTLHDNIQPLLAQGEEDGTWTDGQVSLYAKGRVLGSWLLTMAWDSDRTDERGRQKSLLSQIDPDEYYTLYGDGTEQRDDAPSQDNLYLKLERRQFYALFGDYETGLNQSKLSRYNRTLNGVKAENGGGPVTFIVFASETAQNTARDEIQGNGTSGLYRLSQGGIILNGERISIEVRDRLHGDRVLETRMLSRHLDYEIDYAAGTIYFKQPVSSRDASFNPVFIVAEYETFGVADRTLNAGGRVAMAIGDHEQVRIGVSAIRDENTNGATGLVGADVAVKVGRNTEVRLEAATTDGNQAIAPRDGDAFLVEVEHHAGRTDALAYVRRQGIEFGVDQQNASDSGQQTAGVEGRYKLDEHWSLRGDLSQRENLATTATRDAIAGALRYDTQRGGVGVGARLVEDETAAGALAGQPMRSEQLTMEANRFYLDRKLELLTQAESSLGSSNASIDYPDRVMVGANYQLTEHARLLAGQEFAESDFLRTSTTRVGMQVLPWKGARLESTLNQSYISEYGPRTFGQYGLTQAVMLGERWGLDFSADASQTLRESARPSIDVDPAHPVSAGGMVGSAGLTEDFWALSAGATWRAPVWSWNGRAETRNGETTDKDGVTSRFLRQATAGIAFATSAKIFRAEQESGTEGWLASVDLSWAWRPLGVHWSILDRLEFRYEDVDGGTGIAGNGLFGNTSMVAGDATTRRVINNFALNRVSKEWTGRDRRGDLFNRYERNQFSLYYGAKYAVDTFDGDRYDGYTDLVGVEVRHDLTRYIDIGVQASSLNAWSAGTHEYSVGPMIGFSPVENGWITLGYNHRGFHDSDFDAARYTMQGFYLQLRLKFDQNTKLRWKASSKEEGSHAGR